MRAFSLIFVFFLVFLLAQAIDHDGFDRAVEKLKRFNIWQGPFIPIFFDPVKYQGQVVNDPPEDVKTFNISQKLDNFNGADGRTFLWVSKIII